MNENIHNLETGKVIGTLPFVPSRREHGWIGPQGRWFVARSPDTASEFLSELDVISVETGKLVRRLVLDGTVSDGKPSSAHVMFTGPARILAIYQIGGDYNAVLWNLETGQSESRFHVSGRTPAVSPDGRFLVLADAFSTPVHSIATGDIVANLAVPPTERRTLFNYGALAFSPDTSEIAGLCTLGAPRFVCWNNRGEIIYDRIPNKSWGRLSHTNQTVQWLPDRSGWLLSQVLLHRELARPVWIVSGKPGIPEPPRLINQDWALVQHDRWLNKGEDSWRAVRIPWDRINGILAACREGKGVMLKSGQPVKLVSRLQLYQDDEPGEFEAVLPIYLKQFFEQRADELGIVVSDDAETVVRLRYVESNYKNAGPDDKTRQSRIEIEYIHGDVSIPVLTFANGSGVVSITNRTDEQILNQRRMHMDRGFEKLQLPYAAAEDSELGSLTESKIRKCAWQPASRKAAR